MKLYDAFEHWHEKGSVWLYSDPHFSDEEMKYLRKNYIGDDEQVKRINSVLGKNETIVFLGDIGNVYFFKKIKGYKVLITGNHDRGNAHYKDYFNEIYDGPLFISNKILLSHEPINYPYALNIHGHDHSNWFPKDDNHINVCAEHIDYIPISLNKIVKSGALANISDIHRATIDKR